VPNPAVTHLRVLDGGPGIRQPARAARVGGGGHLPRLLRPARARDGRVGQAAGAARVGRQPPPEPAALQLHAVPGPRDDPGVVRVRRVRPRVGRDGPPGACRRRPAPRRRTAGAPAGDAAPNGSVDGAVVVAVPGRGRASRAEPARAARGRPPDPRAADLPRLLPVQRAPAAAVHRGADLPHRAAPRPAVDGRRHAPARRAGGVAAARADVRRGRARVRVRAGDPPPGAAHRAARGRPAPPPVGGDVPAEQHAVPRHPRVAHAQQHGQRRRHGHRAADAVRAAVGPAAGDDDRRPDRGRLRARDGPRRAPAHGVVRRVLRRRLGRHVGPGEPGGRGGVRRGRPAVDAAGAGGRRVLLGAAAVRVPQPPIRAAGRRLRRPHDAGQGHRGRHRGS
ncbi:MAG: hypothetical protein AVDCRST_MAG64-2096, partial [uncultured Phycisphaerae bacterium]